MYMDVYSGSPDYAADGATNDTIFMDTDGVLYLGGGAGRSENPSAGGQLRGPWLTTDGDNIQTTLDTTTQAIAYYNGVQVLTFADPLSILPTKSVMELTVTNSTTITMNAAALRQPYMLTIFGTNTVTMGSQFSLAGTWTQAATNYVSIFPVGQSTNWFYGVVTP